MGKLQKGYVQVYTGDGKGKTTAALGLSVRALGAGLKVGIVQFMKGSSYSELKALRRFAPDLQLLQTGRSKCIRKEEVNNTDRQEARRGLELAREFLNQDDLDVLILDEILVAHWFGLVSMDDMINILDHRPERIELVLTGRQAPEEIIRRADLVTEMTEIKHYYQSGVPARLGIEM
ncbi:MAG: cob(I)yrinic acid a,c-diamide adenosyltransferase [bacterium]|nr:cob(I)yrinic acid a,c-diamide adenosyltransferase [bacterium]